MAMERVILAQEAHKEHLQAEAQNLRNILLSSVSHDLRTPLAIITGASDTLLKKGDDLAGENRKALIETIHEEAGRLNHIIRNVLSMTRLESGTIQVRKELQSLEEVSGAVIDRLSDQLKDRPLGVNIPADLPLVPFDPILMEQVLTNLLENAIRHTPPGTPVELTAYRQQSGVTVEVADRGPGITAGDEERVFEKLVHGTAPGAASVSACQFAGQSWRLTAAASGGKPPRWGSDIQADPASSWRAALLPGIEDIAWKRDWFCWLKTRFRCAAFCA